MLSFIPQSKENEKTKDSGCKVSEICPLKNEWVEVPDFMKGL